MCGDIVVSLGCKLDHLGVVIGSAGFLSEAREINERIEIVGRQ